MKRIITMIIIVCMLVTTTLGINAECIRYIVTASYLNVRRAPGLDSEVIGVLPNGEIVEGELSVNGWTPIKYKNSRAYVYSQYVSVADKSKFNQSDLDLLARLVNAEAGSSWLTDEHQRAVASVVLNRVADNRFPSTIRGVIYQSGQYSCTWNGMINRTPTQRAIDNARYVLANGVTIPTNVVFQAQFRQGRGVWKYIQGHYFCY